MRAHWEALDEETRKVAGQVARYAFAGLVITILFTLAYWALAEFGGVEPMVSLTIVFVIFTFISYLTHSRFTFQGHGSRDRPARRTARFFVTNIIGYLINQFWVWWLVHHLDGETWWPTIPFVLITPWLTFLLQRKWVYA
ncbi:GtrA family protein [Sphingomicrobium clamense]|uniref:GtrA family protein n=1 Tax=Sphingomicrobium clamense TaxID=2851013 RepID=A0ABS6V3E6_9SPHN|nr:GtrA family protein [Sphingomicrobium sp. B8]MBW0144074.1 GtrA family protein [Sphingomicrobium sp. B8]